MKYMQSVIKILLKFCVLCILHLTCVLYLEAKLQHSYKSFGDFWELKQSLHGPSLNLRACQRRQRIQKSRPWSETGSAALISFGESSLPPAVHLQKCTTLCALGVCPPFWLACWFGPSCSTWRSWPMSTSAMEKNSTVWTSWSTWRVSVVVGTQPTFQTC